MNMLMKDDLKLVEGRPPDEVVTHRQPAGCPRGPPQNNKNNQNNRAMKTALN